MNRKFYSYYAENDHWKCIYVSFNDIMQHQWMYWKLKASPHTLDTEHLPCATPKFMFRSFYFAFIFFSRNAKNVQNYGILKPLPITCYCMLLLVFWPVYDSIDSINSMYHRIPDIQTFEFKILEVYQRLTKALHNFRNCIWCTRWNHVCVQPLFNRWS